MAGAWSLRSAGARGPRTAAPLRRLSRRNWIPARSATRPMRPSRASISRTRWPLPRPPMAGLHDIARIVARRWVTSAVRAPMRAAAAAASQPACPPPTTMTSKLSIKGSPPPEIGGAGGRVKPSGQTDVSRDTFRSRSLSAGLALELIDALRRLRLLEVRLEGPWVLRLFRQRLEVGRLCTGHRLMPGDPVVRVLEPVRAPVRALLWVLGLWIGALRRVPCLGHDTFRSRNVPTQGTHAAA